MAISKIKKNSLTTGIIDEELVTADVITQQTELASADDVANDDVLLIYDIFIFEMCIAGVSHDTGFRCGSAT